MAGISAGVIVLVAVLATFCVSVLALHLHKGTAGGHLKVKFGPFVFEYGAVGSDHRGRPEGKDGP